MTSVTNSSGLNYQNGINPLGRKVRALEADVDMLKKELNALKNGGGTVTSSASSGPSPLLAELDSLKRELATMKLAGFGKGEKGEKGDKGDKGDPGPMTYIAMPSNALPVSTSVSP
jgi:hypothetical protein